MISAMTGTFQGKGNGPKDDIALIKHKKYHIHPK